MSRNAKIRFGFLIAILVWCIYFVVGYMFELGIRSPLAESGVVDTSDIHAGDYTVDNSDFSLVVLVFGAGANAFLSSFVIAAYMIATAIFTLIPFLILKFAGIHKNSVITSKELKISMAAFLSAIGVSFVGGLIASGFVGVVPLILLIVSWVLPSLVYFIALRMRGRVSSQIS